MCPKKLSEVDKKEILTLYRKSEETTSTLAIRYDVSSSTISRFLKAHLSDTEYDLLIQQKRLARTPTGRAKSVVETVKNLVATDNNEILEEVALEEMWEEQPTTPFLEMDTLPSAAPPEGISPEPKQKPVLKPVKRTPGQQLELFSQDAEDEDEDEDDDLNLDVFTLQEFLGEDIGDEDDDEDFEEDEDGDEDFDEDEDFVREFPIPQSQNLEILPVAEASFPKICYLVIDRGAELITRPLKEFRELGKIPVSEVQQKTLPIFDNHRIARRFSNRREKVIKVPDGRLLEKTCSYLQAKGITRLFMDGQVYSL